MEVLKYLAVLYFLQIGDIVLSIQTYYMSDKCGETIKIEYKDQVRIKSTPYGDYAPDIDNCIVKVQSGILDRMMFYFKDMNIEDSSDGNCINDYLVVYDGEPYEDPSPIGKPRFCGFTTPPTVFESSDDYITLSFFSDSNTQSTGFDMIVTQFHEGYCYSWETECSNRKCIDDDLVCNGYNPCGDESDCDARTTAIIVGATVGGVALVAMVISVVICVYCVRKRRVGRQGYVATQQPVTTTTSPPGNVPTNYPAPYSDIPAYNAGNYPMVPVEQQQTITTVSATQP